jgi:hypothetical protein
MSQRFFQTASCFSLPNCCFFKPTMHLEAVHGWRPRSLSRAALAKIVQKTASHAGLTADYSCAIKLSPRDELGSFCQK